MILLPPRRSSGTQPVAAWEGGGGEAVAPFFMTLSFLFWGAKLLRIGMEHFYLFWEIRLQRAKWCSEQFLIRLLLGAKVLWLPPDTRIAVAPTP